MSQPTAREVHTNSILTSVAVAYIQNQDHFIANKVFPVVSVEKKSDSYYLYTKNDWFRDEAKRRGDATESAGSGYGVTTASYNCDVYALHKDIGDQARANTDSPLNPDRDATAFITHRLLMRNEIQWVTDNFAASIWGTDVTPGTLWSDDTSTPIADVETGKRTILINTGYMPNTLTLGYDVAIKLYQHPEIIDRIKYSGQKTANNAVLAELFGVEKVLVAKAVKATNVENETAVMAFTHGKHALLSYSAGAPSPLNPSAGYTFVWKGVSYGNGAVIGIKKMRAELLAADRVEGQIAFDNKVVATDLGYFFASVVA